ncbi:hypothetical protein [Amycolatopsis regifaucium]|uniref:Amidohydrolase 3 domain-containing protein n=1 Tax=Amycolatopsis regifaucium TaxID=546365 RepID=A0A154MVI4_9PSEU|nr:hypothetical protein AVL48_20350 [Amycolatopsis regifaucium]OKA11417.1 hypothetical protein ATP06_0200740 [Amycolatopsis regifaucium]SFH42387.1 hypothetical protein SAMN04489731_104113 [Amycolatopsis regifaucium]
MRTLLRGGRVVDPATGFEGTVDVLVGDGGMLAVGSGPPQAGDQAAVAGYLVGPGFVELHSHVRSIAAHRPQAMEGVTMALDPEAGMRPVGRAYAATAAAGRPLHARLRRAARIRAGQRRVRNTIPSGRTSRFGRGRTYLRECGHRCRANRIRV